jgi:predicted permease
MRTFLKDVRFGLRVLWKSKGFTAVAVVTLALGIGVNTAIFSGVSAFVLRPLSGVEDPGGLVSLFEAPINGNGGFNDFSYPDYKDYLERTDVFEGVMAHDMVQAAIGGDREQAGVDWGQMVTGNFFDVMRAKMKLGRGFLPEEGSTPNTHPVVVLSYDLWRTRFGADDSVVGKTVQLNGHPFTVVGVADEKFTGAKWALGMKFWAPLMMKQQITGGSDGWMTQRGNHWLELMGRLKPGVTKAQAASALTAVATRLEQEYPDDRNKGIQVIVVDEREGRWNDMAGVVRLSSGLALAVVGLVLLVACANVANMMLARSVARRREIGIRLALGAGRWRVVRQLLTESVMLAAAGGALGLLLSFWMTDAMTTFFPVIAYQIVLDVSPDARALVFTIAVSLLTGVVFGLAPAFEATKTDLVPVLKGEATHGGRARRVSLRNALVVAQVALSLVVLVCAALFVQSFRNAKSIDPGFATHDAVLVSVNPGLFGYTKEQGRDFYRRLAERVRAMPGVEASAFIDRMPLGDGSNQWGPVYPVEKGVPPPGEGLDAFAETVGPGFFKAMNIPVVEGRDFDEREREGVTPESAIINETLARRLWPNESAVGKRMGLGRDLKDAMQVIGVARDSKVRTLGESPRNLMYVSVDQTYRGGMTMIVRTPGEGRGVVEGVRQAVKEIDPRMPLYKVMTIEQHLTWAFWAQNMAAALASAFGVLALALAAVGLYGVVSYTVARRTHEIGIRVALGAQARDILRIVLGQGMALTLVGLAAGLVAAFLLASMVLASLLYGLSPGDPATYILVALLLACVALVACLVPARRATQVDPMVALRHE